jgi:hypothetical protein
LKRLTDQLEYLYGLNYDELFIRLMNEAKARLDTEEVAAIRQRVADFMLQTEKKSFEHNLRNKFTTITEIESNVRIRIEYDEFLIHDVGYQLLELIEQWRIKYNQTLNELQAFTEDKQNVHTKVVSDQMNKSLELLLNTSIPTTQKTVNEMLTAFVNELHVSKGLDEVYEDIKYWGGVSEVFKQNDYLFRKVLRGLWAKIQTYPAIRLQLLQRLWEECSDAVGMCAMGHIARLTNVLVGFDENFEGSVSVEEMLQNGMAKISQMECTLEEKKSLAVKLLNELKIEDQDTWLDAL